MRNAPSNKTPVTAGGGFFEETGMACNCENNEVNITQLESSHGEGDTHIVLYCMETNSDTIVISARDSDCFFILLVAHFADTGCPNVLMKAGNYKKPTYVPINQVVTVHGLNLPTAQLLLPFHALAGCDTTSFLYNHGKKTALSSFFKHSQLLYGLGQDPLTDEKIHTAEVFIICLAQGYCTIPKPSSCNITGVGVIRWSHKTSVTISSTCVCIMRARNFLWLCYYMRIFKMQMPEIWTAMHWYLQMCWGLYGYRII